MDDKVIAAAIELIATENKHRKWGAQIEYLGQGLIEVDRSDALSDIKAAVQKIDYRLGITAMAFKPNGRLLVNFDYCQEP